MSAALQAAADALKAKFADADYPGSVKFDVTDEGILRYANGEVTFEDGDADVTISATLDVLRDMFEGNLSPTVAYMTGKIRIDGDMGKAMKLSQIIA